jgi:molybdopterin converting factor subunit 1
MRVTVRLFAILRERAGTDSLDLELADGASARDALAELELRAGLRDLIERMPLAVAVNRTYVREDCSLHDGDELALIPPVSGGEGGAHKAVDERAEREADDGALGMEEFRTGPGYERFMELVGNHVPRPPAYVKLLGARPLQIEPGRMKMEFEATEQFVNPAGVIQGGFLAVMLDETMGPAALAALGPGHMVPTLELKVNFLRPARPGRLVADAHVVHRGRSVAFLESTLTDADGTLLATATATARIVTLQKDSGE